MTGNLAIFDPDAPARILAAAQDETDWGIAWCLLKEGMHPTQIVRLSGKNLHGDWLTWKRVKNERPREAFVPKDDQTRLLAFLENHKPTRKTMWLRVIAMSRRAGYDATPRELRKTAILGWIREYRGRQDMMALVAARAGCSQDTVARYYLSLTQWEAAGSPTERRSPPPQRTP